MSLSTNLKSFPFRSVLNLRQLIEYWENSIALNNIPGIGVGVRDYIKNAPELRLPIEDTAVIEKHRDFINLLMSAVIAPANTETELSAAILPFKFQSVFTTPAFARVIDLENFNHQVSTNLPGNEMTLGKTIQACLLILEKFYGHKVEFDKPILATIKDRVTGLDRVYKLEINSKFCEIIAHNTPRAIDKSIIKFLTEKIYDVDLWLQYLRPEDFEFQGFMVFRLIDVTVEEMLSSIKYDLLEKDAVVRKETFNAIQQKLRSVFNIAEIQLGLAYLDPNNNLVLNNASSDCWKSLVERNSNCACDDYTGSIYERSWMEKRYITIENLEDYPFRSSVEETLISNGIKNILLAPLIDGDETIGMLELATGTPGKLNAVSANKVENVLPMFTAAVKRVKEEMSTEIRALIQEECTAIHPSVQWRFFQAGLNLMNKRRDDPKASLEEIVFKEVYPLFGMADVRSSSTERNLAIQLDLQQNLKLAKDLLYKINTLRQLPLLEEVMFKTEEQLTRIGMGLASGDESNVLEFLKQEINPLLQHFAGDEEFKKLIARYKSHLDPAFGVVYKRRKAFEESLGMINKVISTYLDEAQVSAQQMFPHYFEKYQTDGVEFTLYVGSSLVQDREFDPFYLKNFRLWQLMLMVEIENKVELLKPKLKNNLDITQLILVHDQPLSIRFRADEKQFDVDGAYDIRYEIVKKRIDKAHIKDTNERLTQPGKIAIVYNQAKVEDEYRRYFEYLRSKNLITGPVEEVELEELPGANGLRALRIEVVKNTRALPSLGKNLLQDIKEALKVN